MKDLVYKGSNEQVLTSSLIVAETFGKQHKHVTETIRKMTAENSALLSMFVETTYLSEQNKELPMFAMNRDGFSLLVMGFTGKKALDFKLSFIEAFNKMESERNSPKMMSQIEMILEMAKVSVEQEKKLLQIDERISAIEQNTIEARKQLTSLPIGGDVPVKSFRSLCNEKVRAFSGQTGMPYNEIWANVYKELYYLYGVNLNARSKNKGISKLDAAEDLGVMKDLYAVVSKVCNNETL